MQTSQVATVRVDRATLEQAYCLAADDSRPSAVTQHLEVGLQPQWQGGVVAGRSCGMGRPLSVTPT